LSLHSSLPSTPLAPRHNIRVHLDNSPGNGITATVDLPPTLLTDETVTSAPVTPPHGIRAVSGQTPRIVDTAGTPVVADGAGRPGGPAGQPGPTAPWDQPAPAAAAV